MRDVGRIGKVASDSAYKIKEAVTKMSEAMDLLAGGPLDFYMDRNVEIVEEFFKRCSPFHAGDKVRLVKEIDFNEAYGWRGKEHLLRVGAQAVVYDVDFWKGRFSVSVVMEEDKEKYVYVFHEKSLEPA